MEWDIHPTAKDKTIGLSYQTNFADPNKVNEALDWMVKQTIIFWEVFSKEVKNIKP